MNKVFLIEDHDEALRVWRENKIKGFDLVHIDAHIDFGLHRARPLETVFKEAPTFKELKRGLEFSLAFSQLESDFNKQTNIGNYIFPAMQEGIVKNFYWVIPGGLKEFKDASKIITRLLRSFSKNDSLRGYSKNNPLGFNQNKGIVSTGLFGRKFIICILEKLPPLKQNVLLDIDTDFLVIDSVLNADNTTKIGKREPWILPQDLVRLVKRKVKRPRIITIAYSVNGGYTPIKYKHLADEIAFLYSPHKFKIRFKQNLIVARYYSVFNLLGKNSYYKKAVKINPAYRVLDNSYGPLYLAIRRYKDAKREFLKILEADPNNPASLMGLGSIALARRDNRNACKYYSLALRKIRDKDLFGRVKKMSLLGLAKAKFNIKQYKQAKHILMKCQEITPLEASPYYLLGRIAEKEKRYIKALYFYERAIRLGFNILECLSRVINLYYYTKDYSIITYAEFKLKSFKKALINIKKYEEVKKGKLYRYEKRLLFIEGKLKKIKEGKRHEERYDIEEE